VKALPPEWAFLTKIKPLIRPALQRGGITLEGGIQLIHFDKTGEDVLFGFGGAGPSVGSTHLEVVPG
jgi:hypothetical protein